MAGARCTGCCGNCAGSTGSSGSAWHYLYPDELDDELLDVIGSEPKILHYFDIPIQHINDRVLRDMNRRGGGALVRERIDAIRRRMPDAVIRTSLIVGFPGETEEEFQELCDFLREYRLERAGVFAFSAEEGAPAASMPGQIDDETKSRRQAEVFALQQDIMNECSAALIGRELTVLCCGTDERAASVRTFVHGFSRRRRRCVL